MQGFIQIDIDLPDHPKLPALMALLSLDEDAAIMKLTRLWIFTAKYAPTGRFGAGFDNQVIADACKWPGDPSLFIGALVETGWLDLRTPRGRTKKEKEEKRKTILCVHDWGKHSGRWWLYAEKDKERKRKRRAAQRGVVQTSLRHPTDSESEGHLNDVVTSSEHNRTELNRTELNRTSTTPAARWQPPGQINAGRSVPNAQATRDRIERMKDALR